MNEETSSQTPQQLLKQTALMDAGKRLFIEFGYQKINAKQIAAAADVATGTFYRYFEDKAALLLAIWERDFHHHLPHVNPSMPVWQTIQATIQQELDDLAAFGLLNVVTSVSLYNEAIAEKLAAENAESRLVLERILKTAQATGQIRNDINLRLAAWAIMTIVHELVLQDEDQKTQVTDLENLISAMLSPR